MALSYESIITSAPFRFLVGSNKRLFTVHVAAITHHSKPLGVLVNGDMSEAKEGSAWLEDVDESTFIRFSQYAYTGDYIAADPEILLDSSTIALPPSNPTPIIDIDETVAFAVEEPSDPVYTTIPRNFEVEQAVDAPEPVSAVYPPKKKGRQPTKDDFTYTKKEITRKEKLWKVFQSRTSAVSKPRFHPRINSESCEDYTNVFLCHARLYVFAEKYDIVPLRKLSLNKLHRTLSVFTLYEERIVDIVALLEYSYANTPHRSQTDDCLRSLVIHYATCVVEDLVPSSEFKALLEEPGELASDLVVKMINRLD